LTRNIQEHFILPSENIFHHIGYATRSLEREREFFKQLGYAQVGEEFSDPRQGVFGCFLEGPGPRLELLENLPKSETLTTWLNTGASMYHLAYEVEDLDETATWALNQRGKQVVAPVPAVAFNGRRICFFVFREGPMLEFIEL
jgi:methylmalonyl-CoA/ethylmalonyl-CoA epimerase